MPLLRHIAGGIRSLFQKKRVDRELDEELRGFMDMAAEENVKQGRSRKEALRAVRLERGSVESAKELVRSAGWESLLETVWQDLRYSLRQLRRNPGFTVVAVLTLALGIGANTAIFGATYSILLKPLTYKDSNRLVEIGAVPPGQAVGAEPATELNSFPIAQMKTQSQIFDTVTAFELGSYRLTGYGPPELVLAGLVSDNYFTTLGVRPFLGRTILPSDIQGNSGHVIVLGYAFWQKQFGGDTRIIGKQLQLADLFRNVGGGATLAYTVIGIAPRSFSSPVFSSYGQDCDAWLPSVSPFQDTGFFGGDIISIARLKSGVTLQKANVALRSLSEVLGEQYPDAAKGWTLHAQGLKDAILGTGKYRLELLVLLGAVGFLLLIACVNVSSLLLARTWGRLHEIAVREALGATRRRVVRQLLTETLLLFLFGCGFGLLLARWGVSVLRAYAPQNTPRIDELGLHATVLLYAVGISVAAGIAFGLAPAFQASRRNLYAKLNAASTGPVHVSGARRDFYRRALISIEVSLVVVLLIASGLMLRSFAKILAVPLGLRTDHILAMQLQLDPGTCNEGPLCDSAKDQIVARIRALPGVEDATLMNYPPLETFGILDGVYLEPPSASTVGHPVPGPTSKAMSVGVSYFRLVGIPLLRGREFTAADWRSPREVAIVNQTFAKKFLDGNPIGKRLWDGVDKKKRNRWIYIVGEVKDSRDSSPLLAPQPEVYRPYETSFNSASVLVRSAMPLQSLVPAIREQVSKISRYAIVSDVKTMNQIASKAIAQPRFRAVLLAAFGALALVLTIIGIYGVIAYSVSRRTHEIGVRMALGAQPVDVLWMVIREGVLLVAVGILAGIGGAVALTRFFGSLLFEIQPTDPMTFAGVTVLIILVALLACYLPARRAMRVDPMVALRHE